MLTEKQLAANRANAQHSTGPKTAEGRRRSSLNARRHNLTGQVSAMTAEDLAAHDAFCAGLIKAMAPEGGLELQLAQRVATDSWRLNRASALEDNIFALGLSQNTDDSIGQIEIQAAFANARTYTAQAKSFDLLTLYEQRINRSLHRNLAQLQQLQATRKAEERAEQRAAEKAALAEVPKKAAAAASAGVQTNTQPSETNNLPNDPRPNGFVFSSAQTAAAPDTKEPQTTPEDEIAEAA